MQNLKQYNEFFEDLSTRHKSILHTPEEKHFARINLSKHPVLGAEDLREFMNGASKILKAPFVLAAAPMVEYVGDSDSLRKMVKGEFFVFNKATHGSYEEKETIQTQMESIAADFLAVIKAYYLNNEDEGVTMNEDTTIEYIDNVLTKGYTGVKAYFTVMIYSPNYSGNLNNFNS